MKEGWGGPHLDDTHDLRIVVRKLRKKIEGRSDQATHSADRTGNRLSAGAIAVPFNLNSPIVSAASERVPILTLTVLIVLNRKLALVGPSR